MYTCVRSVSGFCQVSQWVAQVGLEPLDAESQAGQRARPHTKRCTSSAADERCLRCISSFATPSSANESSAGKPSSSPGSRSELSEGNRTTPASTSASDLDQHMAPSEVLILNETCSAWNVDGSSDALAQSGSWIRDAEEATGRKRGRCSFEGCRNQAEVGGHVWMARIGCVIAPICKPCNRPNNQHRMQGSGARLRKNIEVTRTGVTEGMHKAARRAPGVANGGGWRQRRDRRCESCDDDIASRPGSHTQCYSCWRAV